MKDRDTLSELRTWEKVDRFFNAVLILLGSVALVAGLVFLSGMTGCTTQQAPRWPPDMAFESGGLGGYVDVRVAGKVQRLELSGRTTATSEGETQIVGWEISGDLEAKVNGLSQAIRFESTNAGKVHCFTAGLAIEYAQNGKASAEGIPPGFSEECGPPGVSVTAPFQGWSFTAVRDTADPDRSGESLSPDST